VRNTHSHIVSITSSTIWPGPKIHSLVLLMSLCYHILSFLLTWTTLLQQTQTATQCITLFYITYNTQCICTTSTLHYITLHYTHGWKNVCIEWFGIWLGLSSLYFPIWIFKLNLSPVSVLELNCLQFSLFAFHILVSSKSQKTVSVLLL